MGFTKLNEFFGIESFGKRTLLLRLRVSLSNAAVDEGFTEQSHMHLYFKRFYGVSPGRFKKV